MFKQILKAIEEEHLARQNLTREQALELVEKLLNEAWRGFASFLGNTDLVE